MDIPITLYKPLTELHLWGRNYNRGNVPAIKASLRKFGYNRTLSVWREGITVAGNHTLMALRELKIEYEQKGTPPPANVQSRDGDWWVQISDVSHLTLPEAEAYAIADNRTAALADPDDDMLATLLQELAANEDATLLSATGYTDDDLTVLLNRLVEDPTPTEADELGNGNRAAPQDGSELTPNEADVRMVYLFFNAVQADEFSAMTKQLATRYNTTTLTDTVFACIQAAYQGQDHEDD